MPMEDPVPEAIAPSTSAAGEVGLARRTVTVGAVMAAAGRVAVTVLGALTGILIARLLGPAGSGTYYVAQSLLAILVVGTTLGIEHGITYFVSSGAWAPRAAYRSATAVAVMMGIAGAAVGLAARVLFPSAFAGLSLWLTAVVVGGLPFALVAAYVRFVALAVDRYEAYTVPPALQAVLALSLAIPGAVFFGVKGAIVASSISVVALGAGLAVWAARAFPPSTQTERGQLRRAVSFGVKGYAANALQLLNYRLDLFVLSSVASRAAVGRYSIAVAATSVLWVLPSALSDVVFPRVASLSTQEHDASLEMVETKSLRHASLIVAVSALVLAAALEFLVVPIYGAGFRGSINLGLILLPGAAAIGLSSVLASTIVGRGKPEYLLYVALVSTPVTVVLYATLIPWLHAPGAALASTLSYLGTFVLACTVYRRATGRNVIPLLVPTRSEVRDLHELLRVLRGRAIGRS